MAEVGTRKGHGTGTVCAAVDVVESLEIPNTDAADPCDGSTPTQKLAPAPSAGSPPPTRRLSLPVFRPSPIVSVPRRSAPEPLPGSTMLQGGVPSLHSHKALTGGSWVAPRRLAPFSSQF